MAQILGFQIVWIFADLQLELLDKNVNKMWNNKKTCPFLQDFWPQMYFFKDILMSYLTGQPPQEACIRGCTFTTSFMEQRQVL